MSQGQQASDPRDKVLGLLGITNEASQLSISVDYNLSKRQTYVATTRALLDHTLEVLLMIESQDRPVTFITELSSWVPDFMTRQGFIGFSTWMYWDTFTASRGQPQIRFSDYPDLDTLVLTGVSVAVVTGVQGIGTGARTRTKEQHKIKVIRYGRDPARRYKHGEAGSWPAFTVKRDPLSIMNTSWGPYWVETGDIIIVAKGSTVPLTLRRRSDYYVFVGGCWLIDSQLQENFLNNENDPRFSNITYGSIWNEVGKKACNEEEFCIH